MTDTRPPVAPKEGFYAVLRNGEVVGPIKLYDHSRNHPYSFTAHLPHMNWTAKGVSSWDDKDYDIIATISPEAMNEAVALSQQPSQEELSKGRVVSRFEWGESKDEPLTARQAIMQLDADIAMAKASHLAGDYTIMPTKLAEALTALVPLADAACDYADQNCRAFPIATAPKEKWIEVWCDQNKVWFAVYTFPDYVLQDTVTHWRELSPPPSNPPLPEVFTQLGQALERLKEGR